MYKYEPLYTYQGRQEIIKQTQPPISEQIADIAGLIGRPLRAVIGGVSGAFPRYGGPQDPISGFMTGLGGGMKHGREVVPASFAGELQQRFGEMGQIDAGPFTVTGAMGAGLVGDIALDPLTWAGGALGQLRRGGQIAKPLSRAEQRWRSLTPSSPVEDVWRAQMYEGLSPMTQAVKTAEMAPRIGELAVPPKGLTGRITEQISRLPFGAKAVEPIQRRLNARQLEGTAAHLTTNFSRALELTNDRTPAALAGFLSLPGHKKFRGILVDDGWKVKLNDGREVYKDVFYESPSLWEFVDADIKHVAEQAHAIRKDLNRLMEREGIQIGTTPSSKIAGEVYFPRPRDIDAEHLDETLRGRRTIARTRGFLEDRDLENMAAGRGQGYKYLSGFDRVIDYYAKETGRQIAEHQFRKELERQGIGAITKKGAKSLLVPGAVEGLWFSKADASAIASGLKAAHPGWQVFSNASGMSRMLTAGADFAAPFIQGLTWLARDPAGFSKAWLEQFRFFANPTRMQQMMAQPKNQEILRLMPELATSMTEYFEGVGALSKLPPAQQIIRRFQAAFDGFGNMQRLAMAEALLPAAQRAGNIAEITDFINKASGITSTIGLGLSDTQRAIESSVMFFSPRYTRAALALMGDALWAPFTKSATSANAEAAKTLGAMLGAGLLWYQKSANALGQELQLDPTKSDFLTLSLEGSRVGVGSIWIALARTLMQVTVHHDKAISLDMSENPFARFMRSRLAPVGSLLSDKMLFGETYIGEPLESFEDNLKYLATKFMPFALESLLFQRPALVEAGQMDFGKFAVYGTEALGARTFPKNYAEIVDDKSQEMYNMPFDELSAFEQAEVRFSEEIQKIPPPPGNSGDRIRQFDAVNEIMDTELQAITDKVNSGEWDLKDFRAGYKNLMAVKSGRLEQIDSENPGYRDQRSMFRFGKKFDEIDIADQAWLEDMEGLKALPNKERYRRKYLRILVGGSAIEEVEGSMFEDAENYLASLPKNIQQYIEDKEIADLKKYPNEVAELLRQWRLDRRALAGYWDVTDRVHRAMGIETYWEDMTPVMKRQFMETQTGKAIRKVTTQYKENWRWSNPDGDRILKKWGYVSKTMPERTR